MKFSILDFGKHEGKTIPEILLSDPNWFFWALDAGLFQQHGRQQEEAAELGYRARNIKLPRDNPEQWRVNYYTNRHGDYWGFIIQRTDVLPDSGFAFETEVLSLEYVTQLRPTDRAYYLHKIKSYLFGKGSRVTKTVAEQFFGDDSNFDFSKRPAKVA